MPKEIIYGSSVDAREPFHVKVGWTPDREVQLGVEADGDRSLFWMLMGVASFVDEAQTSDIAAAMEDDRQLRLAEIGARFRETFLQAARRWDATGNDDPGRKVEDALLTVQMLNLLDDITIMRYSGVWATLDRLACNRLIRNIRKARDSAYGEDE